jgi:NitT/TauT family transport system substrate-binding protein
LRDRSGFHRIVDHAAQGVGDEGCPGSKSSPASDRVGRGGRSARERRLLSIGAHAAGRTKIDMQLGWLIGGNQIGEVVAKKQGYFEQENIDFSIQPGGPSIDGVAVVASGRHDVGQVSSSPSLMLAVSQGLPIKCFAVGVQKHPYCFFSLKKKPIRSAQDMVGKKVGIQSTGIIC